MQRSSAGGLAIVPLIITDEPECIREVECRCVIYMHSTALFPKEFSRISILVSKYWPMLYQYLYSFSYHRNTCADVNTHTQAHTHTHTTNTQDTHTQHIHVRWRTQIKSLITESVGACWEQPVWTMGWLQPRGAHPVILSPDLMVSCCFCILTSYWASAPDKFNQQ